MIGLLLAASEQVETTEVIHASNLLDVLFGLGLLGIIVATVLNYITGRRRR